MTRPELGAALSGLLAVIAWGQSTAPLRPAIRKVLNSITPAELKGDLSFLASDSLQGRYTPSPGLDVAAEFIASQFRAAGLEPGGDQDYFQTAAMVDRHMPKARSDMIVQDGQETFTVLAQSISVSDVGQEAKIEQAPVLVFASREIRQ